jgi:dynein heavy chain
LEEQNKNAKKDCQEQGVDQTPLNMFKMYLAAVRKNVHVVLAMSPMSEKFRANLMMFPSLVNCTTID